MNHEEEGPGVANKKPSRQSAAMLAAAGPVVIGRFALGESPYLLISAGTGNGSNRAVKNRSDGGSYIIFRPAISSRRITIR